MPVLDNPKHEAFARGLFEGKSQEQAYIDAGYSPNGARGSSTKLLQANANIGLRVEELGRKAEVSAVWTKADALNKLATLHDNAALKKDEAPMLSVARAAVMDYAKLSGWVVEKTDNKHTISEEMQTWLDQRS